MSKGTHHLDLHPIAHNSQAIDTALAELLTAAQKKKIKKAEIIPGKGSGQLMKRVKRYLDQKEVKQLYKRYEIDSKNHGRMFVIFR